MALEFQGSEAVLVGKFGFECKLPLLNLAPLCTDDIVRNLPTGFARWEDGTIQPMIVDYNSSVEDTNPSDVCEPLTLSSEIQTCEVIVPDQELISVQKPDQRYTEALKRFCKANGVINAVTPFDENGNLKPDDPISERFLVYQLSELRRGLMQYLTNIIMGGDSSNRYQVDGIMTQLRNGWASASAGGCDFYHSAIIDWGEVTGAGVGVPAPPDATIDGAFDSITINGYTYSGLTGLNLTEFFVLWMEAQDSYWFKSQGGVDQWTLWLPTGETNCIAELSACMQPCDDCPPNLLADPNIRERFARFRTSKTIELYPYNNPIPLFESPYLKTASPAGNQSMVFAPWSIGGDPTIALLFRDQEEQLNILEGNLPYYGRGLGAPNATDLTPSDDVDVVADELETRAFAVEVSKTKLCIDCRIDTEFAVPVYAQHGFLVIDNVDCVSLTPVCNDELSSLVSACATTGESDELDLSVAGLTATAGDLFRVTFTDGSQLNATTVSYSDPNLILEFSIDLDCTFGDGAVSVTPL